MQKKKIEEQNMRIIIDDYNLKFSNLKRSAQRKNKQYKK